MLGWLERAVVEWSLTDSWVYKAVRRLAYMATGGDAEALHEMAHRALNRYADRVARHREAFYFPELEVTINGKRAMPLGTAAGFDKNAEVLEPCSHLVGFQEIGTVTVDQREGNPTPRIAVDGRRQELYNAQGFPSKGLAYVRDRLKRYREAGGNGVVFASVCGLPPSPDSLETAFSETARIVDELDGYVDGFVWNPFSPNTAALAALRTPATFERYGTLVKQRAGSRPALVKMGPYERDRRDDWLTLMAGWIHGGGSGIVAVNTYPVRRDQVPARGWGYQGAGRSGRFLRPYRQRAISDAREKFPNAMIVGVGGIDSPAEARAAFRAGADLLEFYTPLTFQGFSLIREIGVELARDPPLRRQEWEPTVL